MITKSKYKIRLVRFKNGEINHLLIKDSTGLPLFYPTLYTTTQIRNSSKSSSTIQTNLVAIKVLMDWCASHQLSIEQRISSQNFLTLSEIESIRRFTQINYNKAVDSNIEKSLIQFSRVKERARKEIKDKDDSVSVSTQYTRLTYIAGYLKWLSYTLIQNKANRIESNEAIVIKQMITNLLTRRPKKQSRNQTSSRKGLSELQRETLLNTIKVGAKGNPFQENSIQVRNELIVHMLYHLGFRDGELLNIRISDIDFQQNTLLVARRPDNPDDPRAYQPKVKTRDRIIPIRDTLVAKITNYITDYRNKYPAAKRHNYLLISHKAGPFCGKPLSLKAVQKMFKQIRNTSTELAKLSAHVLRHTWNDRFSELADAQKMSAVTEEKTRSFLMGWKEGSGTASIYTRRFTERKGHEVGLKLQNELKEKNNND